MQNEPWMLSHSIDIDIDIEIPFHDIDMMAADVWHGPMESLYAA